MESPHHILDQIGLCLLSATIMGYLAKLAKQPLVLASVAAGVVIGPVGLKLIKDREVIESLAELGLQLLLFIVGLELDVRKLAAAGKTAVIATLVQVGGGAALAWLAARALGFEGLPAIYIAAAMAFSSTMIVIKALSDRAELDTAAGRLTLAILLLQDAFAIVFLAVQPSLGGGAAGGPSPLVVIGLSAVKGIGLVGACLALTRWVLPHLFRFVATSPELLLGSAVSWCVLVSIAFTKFELSSAMGALIAGVSLSSFPYALEIESKMAPLRDFFVTLFLVSLGMLIVVPTWEMVMHTAVLSVVVIVSRLVTIIPAARKLGLGLRTGILSSLHLAQVSEFALVIVLVGVAAKHIDNNIVALVILCLVVTSTISTYLINLSQRIATFVMKRAGGERLEAEKTLTQIAPPSTVLVGCFRVASTVMHDLLAQNKDFAVVDFNPAVLQQLRKRGIRSIYGDISNLATLEHAGVEHAKVIISSISDDWLRGTDNLKVLKALRKLSPHAAIIVTADSMTRAQALYKEGADYVLLPRALTATKLLEVIDKAGTDALSELRAEDVRTFEARAALEVVP